MQRLGLTVLTLYLASVVLGMMSMVMAAQSGANAPGYLILLTVFFSLACYLLPPVSLLLTARRLKRMQGEG